MAFNFKKSVTFRLAQAAKAQRARSGFHLSRIGLHPGQETVLKILQDQDGRTMSDLAGALGVQPPTVTKMVSRLSAQGLLKRSSTDTDGRLARVHLTPAGADKIKEIDRAWKKLEKEALAGIKDKDRRDLRKLLRTIEKNLSTASVKLGSRASDDDGDEDDLDEGSE